MWKNLAFIDIWPPSCRWLRQVQAPLRSPALPRRGECAMAAPAPAVPADIKQRVDRWADAWLTATFTRQLALRAQNPGPWNYPIAVFSEWRGRQFYLNVRYKGGRHSTVDEFVVRHTRMT